MPNIKSQEKRDRQNLKRAANNQAIKSKIKTVSKKFLESVKEKDVKAASENLKVYSKTLDKAAKKKTVHKNFAANKKSKAARLLNNLNTVK